MPFMHRYCCCGACPPWTGTDCTHCVDGQAWFFRVVTSGITNCGCTDYLPADVTPTRGSFEITYAGAHPNTAYGTVARGSPLNDNCVWTGSTGTTPDVGEICNYTTSAAGGCDIANVNGCGDIGIAHFLQRTASAWNLEIWIVETGGNFTYMIFSGSVAATSSCFDIPGSFSNNFVVGDCGDAVPAGNILDAAGLLAGSEQIAGYGGTATVECYDLFA